MLCGVKGKRVEGYKLGLDLSLMALWFRTVTGSTILCVLLKDLGYACSVEVSDVSL